MCYAPLGQHTTNTFKHIFFLYWNGVHGYCLTCNKVILVYSYVHCEVEVYGLCTTLGDLFNAKSKINVPMKYGFTEVRSVKTCIGLWFNAFCLLPYSANVPAS